MKTVLITGGSRGSGAATVRAFAARGYKVYFVYEKQHEKAQAVAAETGATAICCEVADKLQVQNVFDALPELAPVTTAMFIFHLINDCLSC